MADKTTNYYKYKELEEKYLEHRDESLLEDMRETWEKLSYEERDKVESPDDYEVENDAYQLTVMLDSILDPDYEIEDDATLLPPTKFYVGQHIRTGPDLWVVENVEETKMLIKVIETGPNKVGSIGSYLDEGQKYTVKRHIWEKYYEIWEIPPEEMKRSTSQILLYWFKDDDEPHIDMDF